MIVGILVLVDAEVCKMGTVGPEEVTWSIILVFLHRIDDFLALRILHAVLLVRRWDSFRLVQVSFQVLLNFLLVQPILLTDESLFFTSSGLLDILI